MSTGRPAYEHDGLGAARRAPGPVSAGNHQTLATTVSALFPLPPLRICAGQTSNNFGRQEGRSPAGFAGRVVFTVEYERDAEVAAKRVTKQVGMHAGRW